MSSPDKRRNKVENLRRSAEIVRIAPQYLWVRICRREACSNCAVRNACSLQTSSEQIFRIPTVSSQNFRPGQQILLEITPKSGFLAVFWGYLLPLFLMLSTLLLVNILTKNELTAGIFSIIILVPYYLVLFLNQKYFNQKFNFKILEK